MFRRGSAAGDGEGVERIEIADPATAVQGLRSLVRTRHRGDQSISDLLYRAYITVLGSLFGFYLALGLIDDSTIDAEQLDWVRDHGAAWIGVIAALAIVAGLRSGANGGPLAIDEVDLHHLLMSPVSRSKVLGAPTIRMLIAATALGGVAGGVAGELASRRLPGTDLAWVGSGALAGVALCAGGVGIALMAASSSLLRRRPWLTTIAAVLLLAWSAIDITQGTFTAPTTAVGMVALWPLSFAWATLAVPVGVVAIVVLGRRLIAGLSIERTARRAHLVRQVRFALAQQDIRALILLRRQLGFERPRKRPLVVLGTGRFEGRVPGVYRSLRSYLRWPTQRVIRVVALAAVSGLAIAAVWQGTTAVALGVAAVIYLAALEVVEPFAQELDHPSMLEAVPVDGPSILLSHLGTATALMTVAWIVSGGVAVALTGSVELLAVLAVGLLPAAGAAVCGGAISTKRIGSGINSMLMPDEIAGPQAVLRLAWPLALAGLGVVPVIFARNAVDRGDDAMAIAGPIIIVTAIVTAIMFGWLRFRDEIVASATTANKDR